MTLRECPTPFRAPSVSAGCRTDRLRSRVGPAPCAGSTDSRRSVRWSLMLAAVVAISMLLAFLPDRTQIPPLVESDYCYLLLAADRLYEGHGLTSLQPVAPRQPWTWQADWAFLTKWPIGYPLLVCVVRWMFGLATIQACQWISVAACAASMIGWFVWVKRVVPRGVTGVLLAIVAAACSVSAASLLNPSTDVLLAAALPYVLLFTTWAVERLRGESDKASTRCVTVWLVIAGLTAGGLFWIRYAGVFVPIAIGAYLLIEWLLRHTIRFRHVAVFACCAALPVVTVLAVNRSFGSGESIQTQLNLGDSIGVDFSPALAAKAWWKLTDLGFYDYHWYTHWVYALWPVVMCAIAICIPSARRAMRSFMTNPAVCMSGLIVVCLLGLLIGATTFFGGKFNYVGLDRYYLPVKPLYFVLFAAPVLLIPRRVVRALACVALVVACSWIVQQEWHRPYKRWLAANREMTPYGQWATCFSPNAGDLYRWLNEQASPNLIVVSNFREYVTLETKIPTLPIPPDADALDDWIDRIRASRGVTDPRVLFILDPDNKWRSYWIPEPAEIVRAFGLRNHPDVSAAVSAQVFEYSGQPGTKRTADTDS